MITSDIQATRTRMYNNGQLAFESDFFHIFMTMGPVCIRGAVIRKK
jgi:hypothetical protein